MYVSASTKVRVKYRRPHFQYCTFVPRVVAETGFRSLFLPVRMDLVDLFALEARLLNQNHCPARHGIRY